MESNGVRVRIYLCDEEEAFYVNFPARINDGDSFYIEDFLCRLKDGELKEKTFSFFMDNGTILTCESSIWGADTDGIFQQVYLKERLD